MLRFWVVTLFWATLFWEHEAFLSLWLSRFVLPTFPFNVIVKRFFKIALCLARGVEIALAPVVLASI